MHVYYIINLSYSNINMIQVKSTMVYEFLANVIHVKIVCVIAELVWCSSSTKNQSISGIILAVETSVAENCHT